MKAAVRTRYGAPHTLETRELPDPVPGPEQVLVRATAWSANAHDWHMIRGKPYLARLSEGLRAPKDPRIGVDVAGVVEAVGDDVRDLAVGDAVFGSRFGAYAELVAGKNFVRLPEGLSMDEGAALPTAGLTALQGLRDKLEIGAGHRCLVIGAGGGVGSMAVQIAKALDAEVTAMTRAQHIGMVRSLGADEVVDYADTPLRELRGPYDGILDVAGTYRLGDLARLVHPRGRIALVAPQPGQWIGPVARVAGAVLRTKVGSRRFRPYLATVNREDLQTLADLAASGRLRPVIGRRYRFADLASAIAELESGGVGGKVVITP